MGQEGGGFGPGGLPEPPAVPVEPRLEIPRSREEPAIHEEDTAAPGEDRIRITLPEINAWVVERLHRSEAKGRRSSPISDPTVTIEDEHLVLYAQVATPAMDLLLGLPLEISVDRGRGIVRLLGVRLGQLPLPGGTEALERLLSGSGDPRLARLTSRTRGSYEFDPSFELDGERIRVTSVAILDDAEAVELTVERSAN